VKYFLGRHVTLAGVRRALIALLATTVTASGCHHFKGGARRPFTCHAPERPPTLWPDIRPSTLPVGRFELKVLDPPAQDASNGEAPRNPHLKRRVQVMAEAVPLGTFAVKLAETLGVRVTVAHDVAEVRVSMLAASVPLDELLRGLSEANPAQAVWRTDALLFATPRAHWDRLRSLMDPEELTSQVLIVSDELRAEQLAAMLCEQVLTSRASISVVARSLVVSEVPSNMARVKDVTTWVASEKQGPRAAQHAAPTSP
jgi:hypothetical protein